MRKFLLPILFALLVLPVLAQASVLTFTAERGELFQVKLDGRTINHAASNFVRVANLKPGRHFVEFKIRSKQGIYTMGQKVEVRRNTEANYIVRTAGRSGKAFLRLMSEASLAPPVIIATPRYPDYPRDNYNDDRYEDERYNNDRYDRDQPRYNDNCRNLLTPREIDRVLQAMDARDFESTKLSIAREAVRNGSIMAEDLKRLLKEFDYESTQVEFAKFAYGYLCDREHFYYIYEVFRYDSSVQELERYSANRR